MTNMVLLRNNGEAVAFGDNDGGQCDVPALPPSTWSVQVAAGGAHTVLLRSDGEVVAFGFNRGGRCDVPALPPGTQYADTAREKQRAFKLDRRSSAKPRKRNGRRLRRVTCLTISQKVTARTDTARTVTRCGAAAHLRPWWMS